LLGQRRGPQLLEGLQHLGQGRDAVGVAMARPLRRGREGRGRRFGAHRAIVRESGMNPRFPAPYPDVSDDVRENEADDVTGRRGSHRVLTMAGGCFWCLDAVYRRIRGITAVESGYTGSDWPDPDYETVCAGITGHAEAVRVGFDESIISA